MSAVTKKGLALAFFLILMAVISTMTILGTDGSLIIYNVIHSLVDWSSLIGLGLALGLVYMFGGKRMGISA